MVKYILLFIQISILFYLIKHKKIVSPWLVFFAMAPIRIPFLDISINSMYVLLFVCLYYIFFFDIKRLYINKMTYSYLTCSVLLICLYAFSWIIFNRNNPAYFFKSEFLLIRTLLLFVICTIFDYNKLSENPNIFMESVIKITVLGNVIAILLQIFFPYQMAQIMINNFDNSAAEYMEMFTLNKVNGFSRFYGLCNFPMVLGVIMLIFYAYELANFKKKFMNIMILVGTVFCGVMSMTKTFYVGVFVITPIYLIINNLKISLKSVLLTIFASIMLLVIFCNNSKIQIFLTHINPQIAKYYSYIFRIKDVLDTRYSSNGTVGYFGSFIAKHGLLGVGCASIDGEFFYDSAPFNIIHNGGFVGFSIVFIFYWKLFKSIYRINYKEVIILIALIAAGFGMTCWIGESYTLWIHIYLCYKGAESNKKIQLIRGYECE